jgi:hypothetical protein
MVWGQSCRFWGTYSWYEKYIRNHWVTIHRLHTVAPTAKMFTVELTPLEYIEECRSKLDCARKSLMKAIKNNKGRADYMKAAKIADDAVMRLRVAEWAWFDANP